MLYTAAMIAELVKVAAVRAWQRRGLAAGDFAPLVGISKHTPYLWKKRFSQHGPAGLAGAHCRADLGTAPANHRRRARQLPR